MKVYKARFIHPRSGKLARTRAKRMWRREWLR